MDCALKLSLFIGGAVSSVWNSSECEYTLGLDPSCEVVLQGAGVERRHVKLVLSTHRITVEQFEGATGTLVNGYPITGAVEVEYPASVQIGECTLIIEIREPAQEQITLGLAPSISDSSKDLTLPVNRDGNKAIALAAACKAAVAGQTAAGAFVEYQLVRQIAQGGMGMIFQGNDPHLEREVAVKVSSMSQGGMDPRFEKEAKILAHLAHPNIVPIHAIGKDSRGRPFYSMKLVKGRTLQAVLHGLRTKDQDTVRHYTRERLLTVFRKICDAMSFAHATGIIHRDLKPENVMVGEFGEVLVMDWGLAKVIADQQLDVIVAPAVAHTDFSMTLEGEVMGTPQYMSPEQAQGKVRELDERSDIYSLGGILYAILTLRPPVDGKTLEEVLSNVREGHISAMVTKRGRVQEGQEVPGPVVFSGAVPKALEAVTLKAMALDREKRYQKVADLERDIESYQNGFATSAEHAGFSKRVRLWIWRNKALTSAALVLALMATGFTVQVWKEGEKAKAALFKLKGTAPIFAQRAEDALKNGDFEEALTRIEYALGLDWTNGEYYRIQGNALQLLMRWPEAASAFRTALSYGENAKAKANLELTEELLTLRRAGATNTAKIQLYRALRTQGRRAESDIFADSLKDFWNDQKEDPRAYLELVRRLETKLLPVPGTDVRMSKTEFTVGEWKLYLRAEGLPEWQAPRAFVQTDEHPVVYVSWKMAKDLCDWLSNKSGKEWRLPTDKEWESAVGDTEYPWGAYYPPHWNDGNYAIQDDGSEDPRHLGVDGIFGTAPVASFKPNALGFYDLGGNAQEWSWDGLDGNSNRALRGGGWDTYGKGCRIPERIYRPPTSANGFTGFRIVLATRPSVSQ